MNSIDGANIERVDHRHFKALSQPVNRYSLSIPNQLLGYKRIGARLRRTCQQINVSNSELTGKHCSHLRGRYGAKIHKYLAETRMTPSLNVERLRHLQFRH